MAEDLSPARAGALIPQEALAQVPGYSSAARIQPLGGGMVNRTFRVATRAGRFVLKLHDVAGRVLGADHIREAHLQNAAAAARLAPAVVYADPQRRFMIAEYIAGRTWTAADFSDAARLRQLGATLQRVHDVEPPIPAPFELRRILRGFADRIARAEPAARPLIAQLMERAGRSLRACHSEERAPALIHSDLRHDNILEVDRERVLVDWEYAAVGDPLFDLGCVLAYYPQAMPHARDLLDASGLAGRASLAMLEHASWLYVLLSFLWERARRLAAPPGAGIRPARPAD